MARPRGLYLRVGTLVLTGLALAAGFILFITANRIGPSGQVYECYFRESVQGLEEGSAVRFRGVAIGRVTEIGLVAAAYRNRSASTESKEYQLVFVRFAVDERRTGETASVETAIRQGLRVRLASQGITGVSYLELDFVDPQRFPVMPVPWKPAYAYIPSIPSNLAQVRTAAEAILQQLQDADLPRLLHETIGLISDARAQVKSGDLAVALHEAAGLLQEMRQITGQADLPALVASLRRTSGDVESTLGEYRRTASDARALINGRDLRTALANIATAAAELRTAAAKLPASMTNIDTSLRAARNTTLDLQAELVPILRDMRTTMANLRDATDQLRRNPSQTLLGAPPPAAAGEPRR